MSEENKRNYNTDSELLHSLFLSFNNLTDYHCDVCRLATQLAVLCEFFYNDNHEYDHTTILECARSSAFQLYDLIYNEKKLFDECALIETKITGVLS